MRENFKAIIFDLDDTLLETSKLMTIPALKAAIQVMQNEGLEISIEKAMQKRKVFLRDLTREKFLQKLNFDHTVKNKQERCISEGLKEFKKILESAKIQVSKTTRETLNDLAVNHHLFLVTSGETENQRKKVETLQIENHFQHVFYVDVLKNEKKLDAFLKIVNKNNYEPEKTLCVGNRLDNEIEQGRALGLKTCHILQGEFKTLKPQNDLQIPDYTIQQIQEIKEICQL